MADYLFDYVIPGLILRSPPLSGRGNPNGFIDGTPGQIWNEESGKVWCKGTTRKKLGWFEVGSARGYPAIFYGSTLSQATPNGVQVTIGPAIWYGVDSSIWVKTTSTADDQGWNLLLEKNASLQNKYPTVSPPGSFVTGRLDNLFSVGIPGVIVNQQPLKGRGNPNGLVPGYPGQIYTEPSGKQWCKGGLYSQKLGWFEVGGARSNPAVYLGSSTETSPNGTRTAVGPAIWYGADTSIWVKTVSNNDNQGWNLLVETTQGSGVYWSSAGAFDPYFGSSAYSQQDADVGVPNQVTLHWTLPDLTQEVSLHNALPEALDLFVSPFNTFSSAYRVRPFAIGANIIVPSGHYVWAVSGDYYSSTYSNADRAQVAASNGFQMPAPISSTTINAQVALGSGFWAVIV